MKPENEPRKTLAMSMFSVQMFPGQPNQPVKDSAARLTCQIRKNITSRRSPNFKACLMVFAVPEMKMTLRDQLT